MQSNHFDNLISWIKICSLWV